MKKSFLGARACLLVFITNAMVQTAPATERGWQVIQLHFSRDGKRLIANTRAWPQQKNKRPGPGLLQCWEVETGRVLYRRPLPRSTDVVFSPDGESYVVGGPNTLPFRRKALLKTASGEIVCELQVSQKNISPLSFSPDGQLLAGTIHDYFTKGQGTMKFWETRTGKQVQLFDEDEKDEQEQPAFAGFSSDNRLVFTYFTRRNEPQKATWRVVVRDRATGKKRNSFSIDAPYFTSFVTSPNGGLLAVPPLPGPENRQVNGALLWNTETGKLQQTLSFNDPDASYHSLRFSPDGSRLTALGSHFRTRPLYRAWTWDIRTGKVQSVFKPEQLETAAFLISDLSPDGRLLARVTTQNTLELRSLQKGELVRELKVGE